jgi:magnesium chelatase family protein
MRSGTEPESSAKIRERVMRARGSQLERFASSPREKLYCNAQKGRVTSAPSASSPPNCEKLLERAMAQQGLTARAHDRVLKVARTIADLEGGKSIEPEHIADAIQYRLDRTFWA